MLASYHKGMADVRGTKYPRHPDMITTQCTYLSKYHTAPRNVYSMCWLKSKTQSWHGLQGLSSPYLWRHDVLNFLICRTVCPGQVWVAAAQHAGLHQLWAHGSSRRASICVVSGVRVGGRAPCTPAARDMSTDRTESVTELDKGGVGLKWEPIRWGPRKEASLYCCCEGQGGSAGRRRQGVREGWGRTGDHEEPDPKVARVWILKQSHK